MAGEGENIRVVDADVGCDNVPEVWKIDKNASAILPVDSKTRQLFVGELEIEEHGCVGSILTAKTASPCPSRHGMKLAR